MNEQLKEYLETAKECMEGALAYQGQQAPIWQALQAAVAEIAKVLRGD